MANADFSRQQNRPTGGFDASSYRAAAPAEEEVRLTPFQQKLAGLEKSLPAALGTQPKFDDASQIESVYEDNVGASAYFGFVTAKTGNSYLPKEKTTLEDLIRIVERISDFANK